MTLRELVTRLGFSVDTRGLAIYDKAIGRVYKQTDQLYANLKRSADSVAAFGRGMSFKLSLPLAVYSGFAVKAAGDTERFIDRYGTLLGNVEEGKKLFSDIRAFEPFTPLTLQNLTEGADLLLGVGGMAKEQVIPTLKRLSDIAGSNGQRFSTLALNLAQIHSNQRLMGEDARRFGEAGINLYAELAKKTGKTTAQLRKMGEQGEISGEQVMSVIEDMTNAGGRFYKGSERAAKTLPGLFSTVASALQQWNDAIGDLIVQELHLKPIFAWLGRTIPKLTKAVRAMPKPLRTLVAIFGLMAIAIPPLIWALGSLGSALLGMMVTAAAFQMTMGIGLPAALAKAALAVRGFTMALLTNPWTAVIIAAIAALWLFIDDFIVWMKGGESVLGLMFGDFPAAMARLKAITKEILTRFSGLFDAIKQYYGGLWQIVVGVFKTIFGFLAGDFDMMMEGLKSIVKGFIDFLLGAFRIPSELLSGMWEQAKALFGWLSKPTAGTTATTSFGGQPAPADYGFSMLTPAEANSTNNVGNITMQNTIQVTPPAGATPIETGDAVAEALRREQTRMIDDMLGLATE